MRTILQTFIRTTNCVKPLKWQSENSVANSRYILRHLRKGSTKQKAESWKEMTNIVI